MTFRILKPIYTTNVILGSPARGRGGGEMMHEMKSPLQIKPGGKVLYLVGGKLK